MKLTRMFKESIANIYKNKLLSLASICIVAASLIALGVFLIISINLNFNAIKLKAQREVVVVCDYELDDSQVNNIQREISEIDRVQSYQMITKKEAFENVKKNVFANSKDILEGLDESFLPVCFKVTVKDVENSELVVNKLQQIPGVKSVKSSSKEVALIMSITRWVKIASVTLILILMLVSMFIISNTIKMGVFARRAEINIMKYIGATNWFVRWPFIMEGMVI